MNDLREFFLGGATLTSQLLINPHFKYFLFHI